LTQKKTLKQRCLGNDLANCRLKLDLTLNPNVIGFRWGRSNTTNGALPTRMAIQPAKVRWMLVEAAAFQRQIKVDQERW